MEGEKATIRPRSIYPFYIGSYYIKWVTILLGQKLSCFPIIREKDGELKQRKNAATILT